MMKEDPEPTAPPGKGKDVQSYSLPRVLIQRLLVSLLLLNRSKKQKIPPVLYISLALTARDFSSNIIPSRFFLLSPLPSRASLGHFFGLTCRRYWFQFNLGIQRELVFLCWNTRPTKPERAWDVSKAPMTTTSSSGSWNWSNPPPPLGLRNKRGPLSFYTCSPSSEWYRKERPQVLAGVPQTS